MSVSEELALCQALESFHFVCEHDSDSPTGKMSASARVFQVPELCEQIFLLLPLRDLLLRDSRVCRQWRDVTAESPMLQQKLFFRPDLSIDLEQRVANPFLLSLGESHSYLLAPILRPDSKVKIQKENLSREASWKRMLLCQPPINVVRLGRSSPWKDHNGRTWYYRTTLYSKSPHGFTFGEILSHINVVFPIKTGKILHKIYPMAIEGSNAWEQVEGEGKGFTWSASRSKSGRLTTKAIRSAILPEGIEIPPLVKSLEHMTYESILASAKLVKSQAALSRAVGRVVLKGYSDWDKKVRAAILDEGITVTELLKKFRGASRDQSAFVEEILELGRTSKPSYGLKGPLGQQKLLWSRSGSKRKSDSMEGSDYERGYGGVEMLKWKEEMWNRIEAE